MAGGSSAVPRLVSGVERRRLVERCRNFGTVGRKVMAARRNSGERRRKSAAQRRRAGDDSRRLWCSGKLAGVSGEKDCVSESAPFHKCPDPASDVLNPFIFCAAYFTKSRAGCQYFIEKFSRAGQGKLSFIRPRYEYFGLN
jgi:hypothetical protein